MDYLYAWSTVTSSISENSALTFNNYQAGGNNINFNGSNTFTLAPGTYSVTYIITIDNSGLSGTTPLIVMTLGSAGVSSSSYAPTINSDSGSSQLVGQLTLTVSDLPTTSVQFINAANPSSTITYSGAVTAGTFAGVTQTSSVGFIQFA
jgi:hypothetical protein